MEMQNKWVALSIPINILVVIQLVVVVEEIISLQLQVVYHFHPLQSNLLVVDYPETMILYIVHVCVYKCECQCM